MTALKKAQLGVILKHNPMLDDYHTGIRTIQDIKTFAEVINDDESFCYPDFSQEDALNALKAGTITIYSSKAINPGDFVSTSRRMAQDYAGSGRVNQRTVKLTEVAWINGDEGVYTGPIKLKEDKIMSIRVTALTDLAQTLGDDVLTRLVKGYSPSGELRVGLTAEPENETVRNSTYTPDDKTLPNLYISTRGMEILGITTIYPGLPDHMKVLKYESSRALPFINAFNKAKARVLEKQTQTPKTQAPVQELVNTQEGATYTSPKGVIVENRYGAFCGNVARALAEAAEEYAYPGEMKDASDPSADGSRQTFRYTPTNSEYAKLEFMCYKDYVIMVKAMSMDDDYNREVLDYQAKFYKRGFLRNLQANHPIRDGHIYQDIINNELMETKKPLVLSDSLKKNIKGFTWLKDPAEIEDFAHSLEEGTYNPNSLCGYAYMNLPYRGKFAMEVRQNWGNLSREFIEMVQRLTDKYSPKGRIYAGLFQGSHCLTYIPEDTRYPQLAIYTNGKQITNFHPVWQKDLSNLRWLEFEKAIKQAKEKQASKQAVLSAPRETVKQTQNRQVNPQPQSKQRPLPAIDLTKFNKLLLPKSAVRGNVCSGYPLKYNGELVYRLLINSAVTRETGTHYLIVELRLVNADMKLLARHRLMGKSEDELFHKLKEFYKLSQISHWLNQ